MRLAIGLPGSRPTGSPGLQQIGAELQVAGYHGLPQPVAKRDRLADMGEGFLTVGVFRHLMHSASISWLAPLEARTKG